MSKIRVLVVEDSLTVRARIVEVLEADPQFEVVGTAADGRTAVDMCQALRPDVMTLDMMLPGMTGLEVTELVMAHTPTPILIVSASTNRGELFRTYEALTAGAVDVLEKPTGEEPAGDWEQRLRTAVRIVARIKVITHLRGKLRVATQPPGAHDASMAPPAAAAAPRGHRLVALGASTGGPGALVEILRALPASFPIPIVVVLHIGESFTGALAEWLDGLSPLRVAFARHGEPLPAVGDGRVLLAPADKHLVVNRGNLEHTDGPERHSCRPSVDVLFESVAREIGAGCTACLLTGMGRDGAAGLLAIRKAGGVTIAQDEATSVVFGMPREAIVLGAAERVLPLGGIADAVRLLGGRKTAARRSP